LASKILASFGAHARRLSVVFGTPALSSAGGVLRFEAVGPGGLILSIADQVEGRDLRYEVDSSLAVLSAQEDGRTLLVQLRDAQKPTQPVTMYLGGGANAPVAS